MSFDLPNVSANPSSVIGQLILTTEMLQNEVYDLKSRLDDIGDYTAQDRSKSVASWLKPDGKLFTLPKFPRISGRRMTESEQDERVASTIKELEKAGIPASHDNIRKRGISPNVITAVKKRRK